MRALTHALAPAGRRPRSACHLVPCLWSQWKIPSTEMDQKEQLKITQVSAPAVIKLQHLTQRAVSECGTLV